ncbi:MAG: ribonuclease III [Bryobacteraceae bacterium]|nr:ribonuclease III [Bryobacteraceae bacterium]
MGGDIETLEARLGYSFRRRDLLSRALTHKSRAFEINGGANGALDSNEQLEFLGDSVLGFIVSEVLVERFPEFAEGRLSKRKARLVSADHLYRVAQRLDLGRHLLLGRGEEMSGGREKKALLANALEALIGAIHLDGGADRAREFIRREVVGGEDPRSDAGDATSDFKSALQEFAQARKLPAPRYRIVGWRGPEHSKMFVVEAQVGADRAARAEGPSKKTAGQRAAELLLEQMKTEPGGAGALMMS